MRLGDSGGWQGGWSHKWPPTNRNDSLVAVVGDVVGGKGRETTNESLVVGGGGRVMQLVEKQKISPTSHLDLLVAWLVVVVLVDGASWGGHHE